MTSRLTESLRARPPHVPEIASRLPGRPQNAQAETVARQSVRVGEQKFTFRQQGQPRLARNRPALDRHLDFGCGSQGRNRSIGARRSMAAGSRRIVRVIGVGTAVRGTCGADMPVSADHHIITAARFGPRRRQPNGSQQRQSCRRRATRQFPGRWRDHAGSGPTGVAARDNENQAAQNRHQPK